MIDFVTIGSSSAGNCYIVKCGDHAPLMIEAGLPITTIRRAVGAPLTDMAGCLVSHAHLDHSRAATALADAGVDIWSSYHTMSTIKTRRPWLLHMMCANTWYEVGLWKVRPFDVIHDEPAFGFIINSPAGDRLAFLTDTCYSPNMMIGLTHIAIEANHSEAILRANVDSGVIDKDRFARTSKNHMSIERCIAALKSWDLSSVRQIWLLHLSDTNAGPDFVEQVEKSTGIPTFIAQKG